MKVKVDVNEIDKRLREQGWEFVGPILHYDSAFQQQAAIYKKDGQYIVSGIDSSGENELNDSIKPAEAEQRVKEANKEIRKHVLSNVRKL